MVWRPDGHEEGADLGVASSPGLSAEASIGPERATSVVDVTLYSGTTSTKVFRSPSAKVLPGVQKERNSLCVLLVRG